MTIPVKFYILQAVEASDLSSNDADKAKLLDFVCKLTQKVQKTRKQQLLILDDNIVRLGDINEALWTLIPSSFIPHDMFIDTQSISQKSTSEKSTSSNDSTSVIDPSLEAYTVRGITLQDLTAPVTLMNQLPIGFDGIVLNLTHAPQSLGQVSQVLEVITPDALSTQKGREKVPYYRSLNTKVDFFRI